MGEIMPSYSDENSLIKFSAPEEKENTCRTTISVAPRQDILDNHYESITSDDISSLGSENFQELEDEEEFEELAIDENESSNNESQQHLCYSNIDSDSTSDLALSLDSLISMTPIFEEQDVVCIAARNLFLSHIKSQSCVRDIFFPDHKKDPYEYLIDSNWFDFETYAVLYISQVISKCNDPYNLHALIDEDICDQHLNELPTLPEWKKVGFALYTTLFPDLVKDSVTSTPFRAYMDDREYWASELYQTIKDTRWLYKLMQPIISGHISEQEYNRDINLLFVKLHILDPTLVSPAYHYLRKALPNLNLEIATTNYLGSALNWTLVKKEIEEVIYRPLYQRRVSKLSFESVDVYYGVELLEFIMREPKELQLVTNSKPDNRRTTSFKDRCSIM